MNESAVAGNAVDMDEKISILERSNFDLKMQLFYMTKKYEDRIGVNDSTDDNPDNMLVTTIEDKSADVLALREELEFFQRKVAELESTNLQLHLLRDNEALEYQKVLKLQPNENFAVLEESRNREREVAKTIAEHDAALIKRLQAEVDTLRSQRESDQKLVDDCTAKLAAQMEIVQERDAGLANLHAQNLELKSQIDVLTDVAKHQEILLSNQNDFMNSPYYNANSYTAGGATAVGAAGPGEVDALRRDNMLLRDQLQKQSSAIMSQAEILSKLKTSTAGMSGLELSEAARLAGELDTMLGEKEKLVEKCKRLETENEGLKTKLSMAEFSGQVNAAAAAGKAEEEGKYAEQKTIAFYKEREEELLNALAGVIKRCQQLETQVVAQRR